LKEKETGPRTVSGITRRTTISSKFIIAANRLFKHFLCDFSELFQRSYFRHTIWRFSHSSFDKKSKSWHPIVSDGTYIQICILYELKGKRIGSDGIKTEIK